MNRLRPTDAIVFSGHLADTPDRPVPRLPVARLEAVAARLDAALGAIAGPRSLALTQGAAGGDLLFAERALERGLHLRLLLPLPRDDFIARSVRPVVDGDRWVERFVAVEGAIVAADRLDADTVLGPLPADADPDEAFVRAHAWLLDTAQASEAASLHLLCLWDGTRGGRGGTAEMVDLAGRRGFTITCIDPAVC